MDQREKPNPLQQREQPRPFRFLSNAEFEELSAEQKAAYLRKAMCQLAVLRSDEAPN